MESLIKPDHHTGAGVAIQGLEASIFFFCTVHMKFFHVYNFCYQNFFVSLQAHNYSRIICVYIS